MAAGPSLTEKLSNIQHMPSLIAATVASEKSIDGYLIRDIIKMSYESVQTRVFLQKYLTNLLDTSRNVFVKVKVLQLVVSLLNEGHPDFHRNLQKTPEPFKNASMLKATSTDVAGDCGRIRDLANKVLDRLFDEPPSERSCPYGVQQPRGGGGGGGGSVGMATSYSSNGMGGDSLLGGRGSGGGVGERIQGFGNTPSNSSQDPNSITAQLSSAVGSLFGSATKTKEKSVTYDNNYATMNPVPQYSSGLGGVGGGANSSYQRQSNNREDWDEERVTTGQYHQRELQTAPTSSSGHSEQERKLVDEITAPGGVRTAPTREAMTTFINRCKSLDCLAVVECLKEKLNSDSNQTVLKSLFVIEGLARSDVPDVLSFLDLLLDELNTLSSSTQSSIKAKADKLLTHLNAIETTIQQQPVQEGLLLVSSEGETQDEKREDLSAGLFAGLTITGSSTATNNSKPSPKQHTRVKPHPTTTNKGRLQATVVPPPTSEEGGGDLLDFGNDNRDDYNFDPLITSSTSDGPSLLNELSSLDTPSLTTSNDILMPSLSSTTIANTGGSLPTGSPLLGGAIPMATTTVGSVPMTTTGSPLLGGSVPMATTGSPLLGGSVPIATTGSPLLGGSVPMATTGSPLLGGSVPTHQSGSYQSGGGYYSVVSNRPVQRFPSKDEGSSADGFSFLSKTGKGSAFDFVKDEMKASMGKK